MGWTRKLGAMGKIFDDIDEQLERWICRQPMFFVGSAPLDADGHVNVSPKGPIDSLRVLTPTSVAYLDMVGSGAETIAHVRENGRIVIMLCAFEGPPRILRLHGRGEVVPASDERFGELMELCGFAEPAIARGAARDRPGRGRTRRRFVRLRRAADEARRAAAAHGRCGRRRRSASAGPRRCSTTSARRTRCSIDGLPAVDLPLRVPE